MIAKHIHFFSFFLLPNRKNTYLCPRQENKKYHQTIANEEIKQVIIKCNSVSQIACVRKLGHFHDTTSSKPMPACFQHVGFTEKLLCRQSKAS